MSLSVGAGGVVVTVVTRRNVINDRLIVPFCRDRRRGHTRGWIRTLVAMSGIGVMVIRHARLVLGTASVPTVGGVRGAGIDHATS